MLDAVALQQAHHAERRGPDETRLPAHQPAQRPLGQPVDVLLRRDHGQHGVGVEAVGERQLHEDSVDVGVGGQLGDGRLDLSL